MLHAITDRWVTQAKARLDTAKLTRVASTIAAAEAALEEAERAAAQVRSTFIVHCPKAGCHYSARGYSDGAAVRAIARHIVRAHTGA